MYKYLCSMEHYPLPFLVAVSTNEKWIPPTYTKITPGYLGCSGQIGSSWTCGHDQVMLSIISITTTRTHWVDFPIYLFLPMSLLYCLPLPLCLHYLEGSKNFMDTNILIKIFYRYTDLDYKLSVNPYDTFSTTRSGVSLSVWSEEFRISGIIVCLFSHMMFMLMQNA